MPKHKVSPAISSTRDPKPKPTLASPSQQAPFQVSNARRQILSKNVSNKTLPKVPKTSKPEKQPLCKNDKDRDRECFDNAVIYIKSNNKWNEKKQSSSDGSMLYSTSAERARSKVQNTLHDTRNICKHCIKKPSLYGEESHIKVLQILQRRGKFVYGRKKIMGEVPGVEVGDKFQFWEELNVIGLHWQIRSGIDHAMYREKSVATSVVLRCSYDDNIDDTVVFVYIGEGGNVVSYENEVNYRKLRNEILALINSCDGNTPVRVIMKFDSNTGSGSGGGGGEACKFYCYYGLYKVNNVYGNKDKFKFRLVKLHNQKEVESDVFKNCTKIAGNRKCLVFIEDISRGLEDVPVAVYNNVDKESVPFFRYTREMVYPKWCRPLKKSYVGCNCDGECSDSVKCFCAIRNGGKIRFDKNKAFVGSKREMVYQCGPYCKCSKTCPNRVSEKRIKFNLQIFKTETKGWGVRSLDTIPAGSFVCEYVGELIEDEEAVKMIDNDVYLFHIGNDLKRDSNYYGGYTINAANYGNVARFINHSCSPNLFVQNVLFDHDDARIPHIMLFASERIQRFTELTYDYNYEIDQVIDNGKIKKKYCHCGSPECRGRLY